MSRRRHTRKTLEQRFWEKVAKADPDECWQWTGAKNGNGYGVLRLPDGAGLALAHRVALLLVGRDPGPLVARHRCDTPACVNPAHLVAGTSGDNSADMVERGRSLRGERQPNAKLTDADVRAIRAAYAAGGVTVRALAARFGVGVATAHAVVAGYGWGHVAEAA